MEPNVQNLREVLNNTLKAEMFAFIIIAGSMKMLVKHDQELTENERNILEKASTVLEDLVTFRLKEEEKENGKN